MKLSFKFGLFVFLTFFTIGCKSGSSDSSGQSNTAEDNDMASVSAMGSAVSSMSEVITTVDNNGSKSSGSDASERLGNVYPSNDIKDSSGSNPLIDPDKPADDNWKYPEDLGPTTLNFTLDGSERRLIIGEKDGDYWPLTLRTAPVSDLNISYSEEKIWTKDGNWDPFNRDTGVIDFTAREEYVKYQDGRREDRETVEASGGGVAPKHFPAAVDLSIGSANASNSGDSNDYYSVVTTSRKFSDSRDIYSTGKEYYYEDKGADGAIIKALTKGYSQGSSEKTGLFHLVTSSTIRENSYFSTFENGDPLDTTTMYSISDIGYQGSFNFLNLIKFNWDQDDIDVQSFSKSVKEVDGSYINLKNYETSYKNNSRKGWFKNWDEYSATIVEMSGTSSRLIGTVYRYSLYERAGRRFTTGVLSRFPYADDKTNITDLDGYFFTDKLDAQNVFGAPCVYTIGSVVVGASSNNASVSEYAGTEPRKSSSSRTNATSITASGLKLLTSDSVESGSAATDTFDVSATYDSENKKLTVSLTRSGGDTIASITNADISGDYLSGTIAVNGKQLPIRIDITSGNGEVGSGDSIRSF